MERKSNSSCASGTCSASSVSSIVPHQSEFHSSNGEALQLLGDKMKKRGWEIITAFQMMGLSDDRISPTHFRLVLNTFCFPLSDSQFRTLLDQTETNSDGTINYVDFFIHFTGTEHETRIISEYEIITGHHWTLEQVEDIIKNRIFERMKPVCLALRMFDCNQDGKVQRHELEKILRHFCHLQITEDILRRIWSRYDPKETGLVDYREFLKKLAVNVSHVKRRVPHLDMKLALTWPDADAYAIDSHKRRLAILTGTDDPRLQGLNLDQIEEKLREKIIKDCALLKRAFLVTDPKETGTIPYNTFRSVLIQFTYPMSDALLAQLGQRMGIQNMEKVQWQTFLQRVGRRRQTSAAQQEEIDPKLQVTSSNVTRLRIPTSIAMDVVPKLNRLSIRPGVTIKQSFNVKGCDDVHITRQELRLMIERKGNNLSDAETKHLLVTLDPGHTNLISYKDFCHLFTATEGGETTSSQRDKAQNGRHRDKSSDKQKKANLISDRTITRLQHIEWEKLLAKIKGKIHQNYTTIEMALGACDEEQKGWVTCDQLRRVLHKFCFRVTDEEFVKISKLCDAVDNVINIRNFFEAFKESERERLRKWTRTVGELSKPATTQPQLWSGREIHSALYQLLAANRESFLADLQKYDRPYTEEQEEEESNGKKGGIISNCDFHSVLDKHIRRLSVHEFENLLEYLPQFVKSGTGIDYVKLVESMTADENAERSATDEEESETETGRKLKQDDELTIGESTDDEKVDNKKWTNRPKTTGGTNSIMRAPTMGPVLTSKRIGSARPATEMQHSIVTDETEPQRKSHPFVPPKAKEEMQLRQMLTRKWRDLQHMCAHYDASNSGRVKWDHFLTSLAKCGIVITSDAMLKTLKTKYHVEPGTDVHYNNFLKQFFLAIGKHESNKQQSSLQKNNRLEMNHPLVYGILIDLHSPVMKHYNSLKRAFKRRDLLGNGTLESVHFNSTLKQHGIRLSIPDFQLLTQCYDPGNKGCINYNHFLYTFSRKNDLKTPFSPRI